jgi:hypothetical protein
MWEIDSVGLNDSIEALVERDVRADANDFFVFWLPFSTKSNV